LPRVTKEEEELKSEEGRETLLFLTKRLSGGIIHTFCMFLRRELKANKSLEFREKSISVTE
jgi:predicted ribosome quality control (RQC) complex YloA/Tae2 family protein